MPPATSSQAISEPRAVQRWVPWSRSVARGRPCHGTCFVPPGGCRVLPARGWARPPQLGHGHSPGTSAEEGSHQGSRIPIYMYRYIYTLPIYAYYVYTYPPCAHTTPIIIPVHKHSPYVGSVCILSLYTGTWPQPLYALSPTHGPCTPPCTHGPYTSVHERCPSTLPVQGRSPHTHRRSPPGVWTNEPGTPPVPVGEGRSCHPR